MANDDGLRGRGGGRRRRAGEAMWPMPLPAELAKGLESPVADMVNLPADSRDGGMLIAAPVLAGVRPAGVRWAHLDIAGPASNERPATGIRRRAERAPRPGRMVQITRTTADDGERPGHSSCDRPGQGQAHPYGGAARRQVCAGQQAGTDLVILGGGSGGYAAPCGRPSSACGWSWSNGTRSAGPACTGAASRPRRCCTRRRSPITRRKPSRSVCGPRSRASTWAAVNAYKDKVVDRLWKGLQGRSSPQDRQSSRATAAWSRRPRCASATRHRGRARGARDRLRGEEPARAWPSTASA